MRRSALGSSRLVKKSSEGLKLFEVMRVLWLIVISQRPRVASERDWLMGCAWGPKEQ